MSTTETSIDESEVVREPLSISRVLSNTVRGAVCGTLAAGIVGSLALASLLMLPSLPTSNFIATWLTMLVICGVYGALAGLMMGLLVGLVDSLMRLGWRHSNFSLALWCLVGLPVGAIGGGLMLLILAWEAGSADVQSTVMSFVIGFFLGALGGPFAGPAFGYLYAGRLGRRLRRLGKSVHLQESQ